MEQSVKTKLWTIVSYEILENHAYFFSSQDQKHRTETSAIF